MSVLWKKPWYCQLREHLILWANDELRANGKWVRKVGFRKCQAEKRAWAVKTLEDLRKGLGRYTRPWLFRELEGKLQSYSCAGRYESHFVFRLVYVQCVCVDPGLPVLHCTCGSQRSALASCFSPLSDQTQVIRLVLQTLSLTGLSCCLYFEGFNQISLDL